VVQQIAGTWSFTPAFLSLNFVVIVVIGGAGNVHGQNEVVLIVGTGLVNLVQESLSIKRKSSSIVSKHREYDPTQSDPSADGFHGVHETLTVSPSQRPDLELVNVQDDGI
jgi:ABC-type branched-subunit amino acid transport system permease subunit